MGTFVAAAGALVFGGLNYRQSLRTFAEGQRAERRKNILTRLNEFYGPLATYLSTIDALGRLLRVGKPAGFRTLTHLLDPEQDYDTPAGTTMVVLTAADEQLLADIVELERKVEQLVIDKCGLVDDPVLGSSYTPDPAITDIPPDAVKGLGLLAVLVAHFRVLRMAYEKKITTDPGRYKAFVYPRELDKLLRAKIDGLQSQLRALGGEAEAGP